VVKKLKIAMVFDRKFLEMTFERFSTTTVIRVFNFIRTSAFRLERLFWIAVLLGFTSTTVWSVSLTVNNYLSEPTASQVTYVSNSTNGLHFDDAVVCFQMLPDILAEKYECTFNETISKIVENSNFTKLLTEKLAQFYELEAKRLARLESQLKNESVKRPVDLISDYNSFEPSYNEIFTPAELALIGMTTSMFAHLVVLELESKPALLVWRSKAVERLYAAYAKKRNRFPTAFRPDDGGDMCSLPDSNRRRSLRREEHDDRLHAVQLLQSSRLR